MAMKIRDCFCGGRPSFHQYYANKGIRVIWLECPLCGYNAGKHVDTHKFDVIKIWNKSVDEVTSRRYPIEFKPPNHQ